MPRAARTTNKNVKFGEKPAMKLQIEYHRIDSINGVLRPMRSASQPEATAPTRRIQIVSASTAATAVMDTSNSLAIGTIMNRKTVKSKASSIHPSQAAIQANH
jgi:hypothetical protein